LSNTVNIAVKAHQVLEKVNDATITPGFYVEKPIMGGRFLLKARAKEGEGFPGLLITVYDAKKPRPSSGFLERMGMGGIASFRFLAKRDGTMYSSTSGVDPEYQRMGIATEVYKFVRSLGNTVRPSTVQTDQGKAMWQAWQERGIMETQQGVRLGRLSRFHPGEDPMAKFVPERGTHTYALHPDNWESTFYSLTLKDPMKLRYYQPRDVELPPGTLVADMVWANRFYRAKTDSERRHAVREYRRSMRPVDQADVAAYRMPELLIPREQAAEEAPVRRKRDVFTPQDRRVLANFFRDRKYIDQADKRYLIYDEQGLTFQAETLDDAERYARAIARRGLDKTAVVIDRDTKFPVVIFRGAEDLWLQTNPDSPRLNEKWSQKYKRSINCSNPQGFSQKAHCAARKKRRAGGETKSRAITEAQGQPRVYLDMDGVLADFFSEWARLAGVTTGSYRDIPPARVDPTLNKMIGTDFFARLPKFPTADALVRMIVDEYGGYSICSSPLRGDNENSAKNKRIWIRDNLDPQPQAMEFTGRKEKYARQPDGTPNILIDDRGSNITKWEAAGGIGIKYQADEDSLDVVSRGLERARDIIAGRRPLEPQQLVSRDRSQVMSTGDDKNIRGVTGDDLTPEAIHRLADQRGVAWDNDAEFMRQSQRLTGKRHLDDMDAQELARIRAWLKSLPRPGAKP
jgi:hypothetical protein